MINFLHIKQTCYEIHLISEGRSEVVTIFVSFTNPSAVFDKKLPEIIKYNNSLACLIIINNHDWNKYSIH